jgi:hypothetical protein
MDVRTLSACFIGAGLGCSAPTYDEDAMEKKTEEHGWLERVTLAFRSRSLPQPRKTVADVWLYGVSEFSTESGFAGLIFVAR